MIFRHLLKLWIVNSLSSESFSLFRNVCIGSIGRRYLRSSFGGQPQPVVEGHAVLGCSHITLRAAPEGERLDRQWRVEERYAHILVANFLLSCLAWARLPRALTVAQQPCAVNCAAPDDAIVSVSHKFGYGLMDASGMVELAEQWIAVPSQHICKSPELGEER